MANLNKVELIGRLGQDPICKEVGDDLVANFSLATNEYWKDKKGEKQEKTEWHNIVMWGAQAKLAQSFLKKGSQVFLEGKNQTRKWEKEGEPRYTTEVVARSVQFLDSKNDAAGEEDDIPYA